MTNPKALTDEQIECFWRFRKDLHDGELMPQLHDFARAIERATREQAASTGEPVGWFESPHGQFRANPLYRISSPPQTLAWNIPLYSRPVEQAGSPEATHDE